jgi:putative tricarboxylic transport membrane protein
MRRKEIAIAGFSLLLAAGALVLMVVALRIRVREVDMLWGPRLFPVAVMAMLALASVSVAVSSGISRDASEGPASLDEPNDWLAIIYVLAGLGLFGLLVESAGFVIAAAALFVSVSRGFGSTRPVVDVSIGLVLAAAIFVLFVSGLGLYLPGGTLFSRFLG